MQIWEEWEEEEGDQKRQEDPRERLGKAKKQPENSSKRALFGLEKIEKCTKKHLKKFQNRRLELGDEESHLKMKVAPQAKIFSTHGFKIIDWLKCANVLIKSDTF